MVRCLDCYQDNIPTSAQTCPRCGAPFALLFKDLLVPGTILDSGKYRIDHALGQGGFGITYQAEHTALRQLVAIKEYFPAGAVARDSATGQVAVRPSQRTDYDRSLQRFVREGHVLAKINHPNVVRVRDLFEEHGTAYLVMDLLSAKTLREEMKSHANGILPTDQVRAIVEQLVSALEAVHSAGIYHLDLKPENVLLTSNGQAIVIDFGAAKQAIGTTSTSSRFGTEAYAAPELFTNLPLGPHSDVFELGMMLHEMLTGTLPPPAPQRRFDHVFDPIGLPDPWRPLIRSALQMDPSNRPSSVRQWWQSIAPTQKPAVPVQGVATISVSPPSYVPTPTHAAVSVNSTRRSPIGAFLGLVLLAIVVVGGYVYLSQKPTTSSGGTGSQAGSTTAPTIASIITQAPSPTVESVVAEVPSPTTILPTITPVPQPPDAVVNIASLVLRQGPSGDYAELGTYPQGAQLKVLGKNEEETWLKVQTPDGQQGWMSGNYLQVNVALVDLTVADAPPPPVPPSPTPGPVTNAGTVLHDGETWYVPGWSLTVSNFTWEDFQNPKFALTNNTGRTVLYAGSENFKIQSDVDEQWYPCGYDSYHNYAGAGMVLNLGQQRIAQSGKLEWTWQFGLLDAGNDCYYPMFSPNARTLTLTVVTLGNFIKNARWQADIPRP